jgi:cation:H+ antiporter
MVGARTAVLLAVAAAVPGVALHLVGVHPEAVVAAVVFGLAVVGAAFLLAWAAEAVQVDISAGLALALLALVAVLPEYAVDFVFTWKAGKNPHEFAPDALANMTGGNQLLIGLGWSLVVLVAAYRIKKVGNGRSTEVSVSRGHTIEITFLIIATVYGLTLPLHRTLVLFDAAVLVTIFAVYIVRVSRAPAEEPHLVGPAAMVGALPDTKRRVAVALLFGGAIVAILACAEPFAESLVDTGRQFNIDDFVLISLIAPLASEAPELLVAGMFAWRLQTDSGLGALVSSKVNQWTLLVGTLPIVYAISLGAVHGLPIVGRQREELWVTAAQSAFALAVLANRTLNVREGFMLLGLFFGQFVLNGILPGHLHDEGRIAVGVTYMVLAVVFVVRDRRAVPAILRDGFSVPYDELTGEERAAA